MTHEQIVNSLAIAIMAQDGAPPGRVSFARVLARRIGAPYGSFKTWGRLGIPPGRAKAIADLALELRSVNLARLLFSLKGVWWVLEPLTHNIHWMSAGI